jgi:hypothetical protein
MNAEDKAIEFRESLFMIVPGISLAQIHSLSMAWSKDAIMLIKIHVYNILYIIVYDLVINMPIISYIFLIMNVNYLNVSDCDRLKKFSTSPPSCLNG